MSVFRGRPQPGRPEQAAIALGTGVFVCLFMPVRNAAGLACFVMALVLTGVAAFMLAEALRDWLDRL